MSTQPRELLKAADIANMEPERAVHALNGNAVRLRKSIGDLTGLTQLGVHLITLMPGHASAEYHRHWYEEEFVYVLSGCARRHGAHPSRPPAEVPAQPRLERSRASAWSCVRSNFSGVTAIYPSRSATVSESASSSRGARASFSQ